VVVTRPTRWEPACPVRRRSYNGRQNVWLGRCRR
jgi:hypothetical protein